jgi:hypothetical protein
VEYSRSSQRVYQKAFERWTDISGGAQGLKCFLNASWDRTEAEALPSLIAAFAGDDR